MMTDDPMTLREKISFYLVDCETPPGKAIDVGLVLINLLACVLYVVSTFPLSPAAERVLRGVEIAMVTVFAVEYVLRLWVAEKKLRYVFSFYAVVDLLSILPVFVLSGWGFLRAFRVVRIFRFTRFLENERFFFGTLSRVNLQVGRVLFTLLTVLFVSAGFVHYAEAGAKGSDIHSFGDAVYFTVITLATVGFGDITPKTDAGRWVVVLMILSGMIAIPWQAGKLIRLLLSAEQAKKEVTCPKCGLTRHDRDASHCKSCGSVIYQEYSGDT